MSAPRRRTRSPCCARAASDHAAAPPISVMTSRRFMHPSAPLLRWSLLALDLGAVHDAARIRVERIAPVHGAAIIPHDEIADAPDVLPCKFRSINETPKFIEKRLRITKLESDQIGIAATAEIEHASGGVWVRAYERMHRTG